MLRCLRLSPLEPHVLPWGLDEAPLALGCCLAFWYHGMQNVPGHVRLSLPQIWNPSFLQDNLASLFGDWCVETNVWGLGCLLCSWIIIAVRPSADRPGRWF